MKENTEMFETIKGYLADGITTEEFIAIIKLILEEVFKYVGGEI